MSRGLRCERQERVANLFIVITRVLSVFFLNMSIIDQLVDLSDVSIWKVSP